ncbi:MAG: riboflavin biosynthesis protein RibF [Phycisphaerae bacterium]|nr:riboflavin biosynthesis protein RibF [Phycisphaerae bacterium]
MATAVTIGNFDGVHLGHAALIRAAREAAGQSGRVVAMAFDPHPLSRLRPGMAPARLTGFDHRAALLRSAGADEVERLEPTEALLAETPEEFIRNVVVRYRPSVIVEGDDFHFGKGRAGTPATLDVLGRAWGFRAVVVPPVEVELSDQLMVRASSSLVRWLLAHGRVRDAAIVLGRPYELRGEVVRGDQRGRTIGFPTANIATECHVPGDGVYAARATLPDGRVAAAAVNIGTRPTFAGADRRVEAHLIGVTPGGAEYGWRCALSLISRLRDQVRFDSVDRLRTQLSSDVARARNLISA